MVGCEVADFLGELGHDVSVIELRDTLGADVIPEHRVYLMKAFEQYHIKGITGAKVASFEKDGVTYLDKEEQLHRVEGMDSVVLAMGYRNNDPLSETLKTLVPEVYTIGDAIRARRALDATKEALEAAMQI